MTGGHHEQFICAANPTRIQFGVQAKLAFASLPEDKTLAELCHQFELHPTQITDWKKQLLSSAAGVFGVSSKAQDPVDLVPLHTKIGQQGLEIDFLEGALNKAGC